MDIHVGIGLGTDKDQLRALQEAVRQAKYELGAQRIDFALVFSTIEFAHPAIAKTLSQLLGPVNIVGASSFAVITSSGIFKYGIAVALFNLPEGAHFNTACVEGIGAKTAPLAGAQLGEKLLYGLSNIRRNCVTLFSDGLLRDASGFLSGLQEKLGRSFPLIGAGASDKLGFKKTYQYIDDRVTSDSACGILWAGKLNFGLGAKHGWKPLGKPHYATKTHGNIVSEIDNAPAVKMYEEYFAKSAAELKKDLKRISILYPAGIYIFGEEEYLLRNILSIEDNGALVFQGNVPQDSLIRLMIGTKESCLAACRQALEDAKQGLRAPNFFLVFDSISRYILLGRDATEELKIIKATAGEDTPIIGLYTYGEQAPLKAVSYQGASYAHNQTIAVLAMEGTR